MKRSMNRPPAAYALCFASESDSWRAQNTLENIPLFLALLLFGSLGFPAIAAGTHRPLSLRHRYGCGCSCPQHRE